jgi:hypothetical protein
MEAALKLACAEALPREPRGCSFHGYNILITAQVGSKQARMMKCAGVDAPRFDRRKAAMAQGLISLPDAVSASRWRCG